MLPGLRLLLAATATTVTIVVLGFALLVKLQVAHRESAGLTPVEARFAGLSFAARADWSPIPASRTRSLEALAPFANIRSQRAVPDRATDTPTIVTFVALARPGREPPLETPTAEAVPPAIDAMMAPDGVTDTAPTVAAVLESANDGLTATAAEMEIASVDVTALSTEVAPAIAAAIPAVPTAAMTSEAALPAAVPLTPANDLVIPLPLPRPAIAAPSRRIQSPAQKKKAVRTQPAKRVAPAKRAAPAKPRAPAAPAASTNPFAALFGG